MIPLFKTLSFDSDIQGIQNVLSRGNYWACGKEIEEFENQIGLFTGRKYAVLFNSGTSALTALLQAHGIKNKEVICPSFTFIATANTILLAEGRPVFAECETDTFGLDVKDVGKRITKDTKAIIGIHYGGTPARDTLKLKALAEENGLLFIEDAAQSFGAQIGGRKVGSFGDSSIFSFCQNKVITTGEGGVALCDNIEIYEKLLLIRSHGRVEISGCDYFSNMGDNDYIIAGNNWRMPSINAALGLSQLSHLNEIIDKRQRIGKFYDSNFSGIVYAPSMNGIEGFNNIYQMYTLLLDKHADRDRLQNYLNLRGITTKVYFNPVHQKTLYQQSKKLILPISEDLSARVLTIPCFPSLTEEEIYHISSSVVNFFKN